MGLFHARVRRGGRLTTGAGARHRWRFRLGMPRRRWVAATVAVAVLAGATGGVLGVRTAQQRAIGDARSERAAAITALDAALTDAGAAGIGATDLAAVVERRRAILEEEPAGTLLLVFDAGEASHLRKQAAGLRDLGGEVARVWGVVLERGRAAASADIDRLDAMVARAASAGLDAGADRAAAETARQAITAATTPAQVIAAVALLPARLSALEQRVSTKLAADQTAIAAARSRAQAALTRADRLVEAARPYPTLAIGDAVATVAAQHRAYDAALGVAALDAVTAATKSAADRIDAVLSARSTAYAEISRARSDVTAAARQGIDTTALTAQLAVLQQQLDKATTAAAFDDLTTRIHDLAAPVANRLGVAALGPGKVIVISLARQELTAYEDGVPYLTTVVTTGRPALPTVTGSFRVQTRYHPFTFYSEWPPGSPYWFPPSYSNYAMFFFEGYAIHDAPWRSAYGPGTNLNGSHGCVNVPFAPMQRLFAWTPVGTRVIVH